MLCLTGRQATELKATRLKATARATHYERRPWCSCTRNLMVKYYAKWHSFPALLRGTSLASSQWRL